MSQFLKGKVRKILDARKAEFELRQRIRKEEEEKEQKRKHANHLRKIRREEQTRAKEGGLLTSVFKHALTESKKTLKKEAKEWVKEATK